MVAPQTEGRAPLGLRAAFDVAYLLRQVRGVARQTQQHRPDSGGRPGCPVGWYGEWLFSTTNFITTLTDPARR